MNSYESLDNAKLSISFKLPFNENQLKKVIDQNENIDLIGETITPQVSNIQLGPVVLNLGTLTINDEKEYSISYNFERFMLEIAGEIMYIGEAFKEIYITFKNDYDFNKIARFIEFTQNGLIINQSNLSSKLWSKFKISIPEEISSLYQSELGLRDFTIASSISPLDNDWFSITISTVSLSSSGKLHLRIIKRFDTNFDGVEDFLTKMKNIDEVVVNWMNQSNGE